MNELKLHKLLKDDPAFYIKAVFNDDLWQKQKDIAQALFLHKRIAVKSCHGSGKSFLSARLALQFLSIHNNARVITTAPTFRQVKEVLWREIAVAYGKAKPPIGGKLLDTALELGENWFAIGFSTNEPDAFQGFHAEDILFIGDEASGIPEDIYEASEGILSTDNARSILIGNPTNITGTFHKAFELPNYKTFHISAFDTPNFTTFGITLEDIKNNTWNEKITSSLPRPYLVTPEWVYDKLLRWGEGSPMWESRVLGEFPQQGTDTLIPLYKIEQAVNREIKVLDTDPEETGVDVARFGDDKTIFVRRKGAKAFPMKQFHGLNTTQVAEELVLFLNSNPFSNAKVDAIGVGAGVVDASKSKAPVKDISGVNVGLPALDPERFLNIRAEMYWNLRNRFINDDISIPDDDELKAQLSAIKYKYTAKGQVQMESKEDMKKRGLPSPDKADALALAFVTLNNRPSVLDFMKGIR